MRDLFDYLQSLIIGQGREAGQKLQLYPWQKRFLRGAFGQPDNAALSLARGGGGLPRRRVDRLSNML